MDKVQFLGLDEIVEGWCRKKIEEVSIYLRPGEGRKPNREKKVIE